MDETRKLLGSRIRETRKKLHLTQKAFGELLGVGISAVSAYEAGDSAIPPESLLKIAQIGEVSLDWLIAGKDYCPSSQSHLVCENSPQYEEWPDAIKKVAKLIQGHPGSEGEILDQLIDFYAEQGKRRNEDR